MLHPSIRSVLGKMREKHLVIVHDLASARLPWELLCIDKWFPSFDQGMTHRYLAMGVGVLIVSIVVIAWRGWLQSKRRDPKFSPRFPMVLFLFICLQGAFGAWTVTLVSAEGMRKALPLVLVGVLAYTLARKDLGRSHTPHLAGHTLTLAACAIGVVVGFYDGFFGPGAGSFYVFAFVRLLGFDFLNASASAKLMNSATNLAALVLFAAKGHVWWHIALVMAVANIAGSLLGTRLALKHGAGFVRIGFIAVVSALILKTGWDAFLR